MNINADSSRSHVIQGLMMERGIDVGANQRKEWKYCFIYLLAVILILVLTVVNLSLTFNSFDNGMWLYDARSVCATKILRFDMCTKAKTLNCTDYTIQVKECTDEVDKFNKMCGVYVTEFCGCKNENNITTKVELVDKCSSEINDIKECNTFPDLKIDPSDSINSCK
jgi:hypothetical protein